MKEKNMDSNAVNQLCRALKTLMQQKQLEKITIREITALANTHRLTFYYHFKDKYDLLQYMFFRDIEHIRKEDDFKDTLGLVTDLFKYLVEHEHLYNNAFKSDDYQSLKNVYTETTKVFFETLIDELSDEKSLKINRKSIIDFYSHATTLYIMNWLKETERTPYEEAAKQLVMMIEHGFIKVIGK